MGVCRQTIEKLEGYSAALEKIDRPKEPRQMVTTGTKKSLTIQVGSLRCKKVQKKLAKLRDFASNSTSYL